MSIRELSLGVILSLDFLRPIVFSFTLGLWDLVNLVSGSLSPKECQVLVLSHRVGPKSNHMLVGYSPRVTIAQAYFEDRTALQREDSISGLVFTFLF